MGVCHEFVQKSLEGYWSAVSKFWQAVAVGGCVRYYCRYLLWADV